jgi:hypothetical protein
MNVKVNKQTAHFQAFGYEPLRMKPVHFASGFFIALTGKVFANQLLNQVAVIRANKGILEDYRSEVLMERLKADGLIAPTMQQAAVELLRVQVNGVVNNDDAMYPAFKPYRPKGNDYTFISRRVLTIEDRTDGFAGFFVASVLGATKVGRTVLQVGQALAAEPARTLEHLIEPLIAHEDGLERNLKDQYESRFGELNSKRLKTVAVLMEAETAALARICRNAASYSHYKRVRFYVIGLLAWLMNYLIKTAAGPQAPAPLMFFDFSGAKEGRTRIQSKACYARLRQVVGQF